MQALKGHWHLPYTKHAIALLDAHLAEPLTDGRNVLYLADIDDQPNL